jgi:PTH1 family peptidyl-tRNA hydrolase
MFLIVGLGNPGTKYNQTPHNIGFEVIGALKEKLGLKSLKKKALFSTGDKIWHRKKIVLCQPLTFMNNSGKAIQGLIHYYKERTSNLIIIHDDIDLPLGHIRISKNVGSAGHKGVASIIQELGTEDFIRIRVGIQPEKGKPDNVEGFVLKKSNIKEQGIAKKVVEETLAAIEALVKEGWEKAANAFNK